MNPAKVVKTIAQQAGIDHPFYIGAYPSPESETPELLASNTGGFPEPQPGKISELTVQVRTRGTSYDETYEALEEVRNVVAQHDDYVSGSHTFAGFFLLSDIAELGFDGERFHFSLNFRIYRTTKK